MDSSASTNGQDENCYVLFSSQRGLWSSSIPRDVNAPSRGIIAMEHLAFTSRSLATTEQMQFTANKPGVVDISGLISHKQRTAVIGIACDLESNSMWFYLNDQPLRVTALRYMGRKRKPMADAGIAVGEPFVWKLNQEEVRLSECYPYLCVTDAALKAEFIEWIPPPPPPPPPPVVLHPTPPPQPPQTDSCILA